MISFLKKIWKKEEFHPSFFLGIWINPSFITRRALLKGICEISQLMNEGKLLDVGCGSKPYEKMFDVEDYIGIDTKVSGHNHSNSKVDKFYDGKKIPFEDEFFENVFSSQVFEHVFNIDELFEEINRVLKSGGKLGFTCPFVWDEHEQPYDFWRYSSFGVERLLIAHGFKLVKLTKSTGYFEAVMQMLSAYIAQHVLPKNAYLKILLMPLLVGPVNIIAIVLSKVLPRNTNFYLDNIVIAEKL